jgi:hypothetical protein
MIKVSRNDLFFSKLISCDDFIQRHIQMNLFNGILIPDCGLKNIQKNEHDSGIICAND